MEGKRSKPKILDAPPKASPAKTHPPAPWTGRPPSSRAPDGEWTGSRGAAPQISRETSGGQRTWTHSALALCSLSHTEPCFRAGECRNVPAPGQFGLRCVSCSGVSATAAPFPSSLCSEPASLGRGRSSRLPRHWHMCLARWTRGSGLWELLDPRECWVFLVRFQLPDSVTLRSVGS